MFVRIGNSPRDYAWGSTTAMAELLGTEPSGRPEAELWLGAHPGSPARVLDPELADGAADLAAWERTSDLPYLLKVLAAESPLSLQAHPSSEQARAGFERENAAGLAPDSPDRNYKDPFHKPELIFALSDPFEALCGFRDPVESRAALERLAAAATGGAVLSGFARTLEGDPAAVLRRATEWLLGGDPDADLLVAEVVRAARALPDDRDAQTVQMVDDAFPGDPGIVLALLLNRATLRPGEVLYLPAGNIHAYLRGLGIELMAASDNVLRGGLTRKRIDVPELVSVLDFTPIRPTPLAPGHPAPGVETFRPDVPDFALDHIALAGDVGSATVTLPGTAIALATEGHVELRGATGALRLERGQAAIVTEETELAVSGQGVLFVAHPNG
ncbi:MULTISPECIES: mannose-6-phosphate isomerase, class I [unclassified Leifsonia]|uniref:mannose-6-phosphate isomerase, class I n=1 Tax=unclassified Leifsonia TaxID=2663824 RepID=UPI0008A78B03|nr:MULTISPECIES: mannose-6-phosphate isomerase, class I [unclassified Leifsonia]SEH79425.1 mannose-6-phosphate isomerase, type 1 [Leifsonia sp. CL154]SFL41687.1 mannose-6-phosphate isomerase, type 1 [Leifsonia sp. CL147]